MPKKPKSPANNSTTKRQILINKKSSQKPSTFVASVKLDPNIVWWKPVGPNTHRANVSPNNLIYYKKRSIEKGGKALAGDKRSDVYWPEVSWLELRKIKKVFYPDINHTVYLTVDPFIIRPTPEENKGNDFLITNRPLIKKSTFEPKKLNDGKINKKARGFVKKIYYFLRHDNKKVGSPNHWHTKWENLFLHIHSIKIRNIIQKYYFQFGLYVNKLHILLNTGIVNVLAIGYRVFKRPKAKLTNAKYKKTFKSSKLIMKFASFFIETNKVKAVHLNFYQLSLPRKYRIESGVYSFNKIKRLYYFKECLQLVYAIFKGYGSAYLLGSLIYTYTRRNPRRVAFLNNIQRLLVWHNKTVMGIKIQGVRVEVKGRFNAKSRAIKRILSIGCVKIHVKASNVDFAQITSLTKFGSLGIKIWICPKNLTKLNFSRIMAKSPLQKVLPQSLNQLQIML